MKDKIENALIYLTFICLIIWLLFCFSKSENESYVSYESKANPEIHYIVEE